MTQKTAEALAERFNERAVELGLEGLPRIAFMTCCFVTVQRETGTSQYFAERFLSGRAV